MTTVFLSGSRRISRLSEAVRTRLQNIIDQGFHVLVGDAHGADTAMQSYLNERGYRNVTVYCSGQTCRNNVGSWVTRRIDVDPKLRGRAFHTEKDRAMAAQADYGLVVWDGRSPGSLNNVREMLRNGKRAAVYVAPRKGFFDVRELADTDVLLRTRAPAPERLRSGLPLLDDGADLHGEERRPMADSGLKEDNARKIVSIVACIPRGGAITYGDISGRVYGHRRAAPSVAAAIGRATRSQPDVFPWWRVVNRYWKPTRKPPGARERLAAEGVSFTDDGAVERAYRHRA